MEDQQIYKLKLHETHRTTFGIHIMRVPDGWVYDMWDAEKDCYKTGMFIPYDNDMQIVVK